MSHNSRKRPRELKYIADEYARARCLNKRLNGLWKKADDLETLTGVKVTITVTPEKTVCVQSPYPPYPLEEGSTEEDTCGWQKFLHFDLSCDERLE